MVEILRTAPSKPLASVVTQWCVRLPPVSKSLWRTLPVSSFLQISWPSALCAWVTTSVEPDESGKATVRRRPPLKNLESPAPVPLLTPWL